MGGRRVFPFLIVLLVSVLVCSCSQLDSTDPQLKKLDKTVNALSNALQEPGLYELLKSIEDMDYTTGNTLDVLFSAYGAAYWPPPGAEAAASGELLPVVREKSSGSWQVVVIAENDQFLLRGYGESQEQPLREETVDFPKSTTETR
jgi:hypothetical protein